MIFQSRRKGLLFRFVDVGPFYFEERYRKNKVTGVNTKTLERIEQTAKKLASGMSLEVKKVEYNNTDFGPTLTVTVASPAGQTGIEDCESLSRPLSKELDRLDLIKENYVLEVCSPGV